VAARLSGRPGRAVAGLTALALLAGCFGPPETDRRAIEERYTLWHKALAADRTAEAYALMSPAFRAARTLEQFDADYRMYGQREFRLRHDHGLSGRGDRARLVPMDFLYGPENEFAWQKVEGTWYLTGEVDWYTDTPLGRKR